MYLSAEDMEGMDIGQPLPVSQKSRARLYLSWKSQKGVECKMIGPETKCFCNHKFKDHDYLTPKGKKAPCTSAKCKCRTFDYIPSHGSYDFKCLCKHSFKEHDCISRKCNRQNCTQCTGFVSAWTCSCGSRFSEHETIVQTYEQRKAKGKVLNDMGRMSKELNCLTEEGSLYRPIKVDPQERAKQKQFNNPYVASHSQSQYENHEEELEEVNFDMRKRRY